MDAKDPEDLVQVEENGVLWPVGRLAAERLRANARENPFRLLPSPGGLIVLKRKRRPDEQATGAIKLAGEVTGPGAVCDLLAFVAQAAWKGEVLVLGGKNARSLFLDGGNVVGAQTNVVTERIGALLQRLGILTAEEVRRVEAALGGGRKFGETAVALGLLSPERLFEGITRQVSEIAFAALQVADGMFYFLDQYDPARVPLCHQVGAMGLIMEAARRTDEGKYFRERIPSPRHVPVPLPGRPPSDEQLRALWEACDGRRTVLDLQRLCHLDELETARRLCHLLDLGRLQIAPPGPGGPEAIVATFNEAIAIIYRSAEENGYAPHLREHLARFAAGIPAYGVLLAGVGPAPDGRLDEARLVANLRALGGDDAEKILTRRLHVYAAFALFDAASQLPKDQQQRLTDEVAEQIKALAPKISEALADLR